MAEDKDVHALNKELERVVNDFFKGGFENCDKQEFERRIDVVMKSSLAMLAATQATFIRVHGMEFASRMMQLSIQSLMRLTTLHLNGEFSTPRPDPEPEAPKPRLH